MAQTQSPKSNNHASDPTNASSTQTQTTPTSGEAGLPEKPAELPASIRNVSATATPSAPSAPGVPPDPFDPSKLALGQDFAAAAGVKKVTTLVPVRKPAKHEWVWVHGDPNYQLTTAALVYKEDREEVYLVDQRLWPLLGGELRPICLFTTINRQGVVTLWPVKLPGPDGRHDTWNASALDAVAHAKKRWTRVVADMSLGGYNLFVAAGELEPPQWPDLTFKEILTLAFRGRFVDSADHLVLKKLRGEA